MYVVHDQSLVRKMFTKHCQKAAFSNKAHVTKEIHVYIARATCFHAELVEHYRGYAGVEHNTTPGITLYTLIGAA